MRIADNVEMLEIIGEHGTLYPVLTWDEHELVLVDTAIPGQTELLKEAVSQAGFSFEKITKVILTHHDMDHIGSAKTLAGLGAEILAHEDEVPYIQGDKTSIRLAGMEARLSELTDGERAFYERAKQGAPYFYVQVNKQLKDNETLDVCGGIKVIHAPGHTPGHIMLLLEQSSTIVAGDGANIINGSLTGANPEYTQNMEQAQVSFDKMMNFKPASVLCYHGGCFAIGENKT
jgi:glyoxylase-like metal-dependent hydrolase (beta-lactamase superfamily II)